MPRLVAYFIDTVEFGGAERALLNLLAGLDRERYRAVLYHHPAAGLRPLTEGAAALGIEMRPVPRMQGRRSAAPRIRQACDAAVGFAPFLRELRNNPPDIFHAHQNWPMACKFALAAARLARVPRVIATTHLFPDFKYNGFRRWQHAAITAGVSRYIAVSGHIARSLRFVLGVPGEKIEVIHNAVRESELHPDPELRWSLLAPGTNILAITPARLCEQKGQAYLLRAARELPHVTFALAGDGPDRAALELLARELNVSERVRFLGQRDDIELLLASSDLMVLPSLAEGLPLSVLEAMAAGVPVVATDVGGTREAVAHGVSGYLAPSRDVPALATAIRELATDSRLRAVFGAEGRRLVKSRFSQKQMIERTMRLYEGASFVQEAA